MDVNNNHMVSVCGNDITMFRPPTGPMSKDEALVLAAWLVMLADPLGEKFGEVLEAMQSA